MRLGLIGILALAASPAFAQGDLSAMTSGASCLIEARATVRLAAEAQGVIAELAVRRGDAVKKDQALGELESSVERAMLKAARLKADASAPVQSKERELLNAQAKLQRQRTLSAEHIASQEKFDQADTDVAVLQSQLDEARLDHALAGVEAERMTAALERRRFKSPVDGFVVSIDRVVGEYADVGATVLTLAETSPLRVKLYLPVEAYPLVAVGMTGLVRPLGPVEGRFPAKVTAKDRQIDAESNLFQVQLELPNADGAIPAGLRCEVSFAPPG